MSDKTGIQWTDATWNPVTGCSKVSPGCKNCYAEHDWPRLSKNPKSPYFGRAFTDVRCHPDRLADPDRWRKPRRVFVNSMSDLFHEAVPDDFLDKVFSTMQFNSAHTFQILTKRPERMRDYLLAFQPSSPRDGYVTRGGKLSNDLARGEVCFHPGKWPLPNVHLGVSVENQETADERIPILLHAPAAVRFVSVEPLLEAMNLNRVGGAVRRTNGYGDRWIEFDALTGWEPQRHAKPERPENWDTVRYDSCSHPEKINWVIVGGESGPNARPCNIDWIRDIVRQCRAASVPPFVKQLGSMPIAPYPGWSDGKILKLRDRKGGDPAEWPEDLRNAREFPR